MSVIMMKKEYITPAIEIVEFDAKESMLLTMSESTGDGQEWSNKRQQPTVSTWSSSNWNADEEF
jgi:hypothetical protein